MHRHWPTRIAMMAVFLANGVAFGSLAGNVARLREAAGLGDARLGLTLLAASLGAALAMPVTGRLASRWGPSRTALLGGLALVPTTPLPALAIASGASWPVLLAAMVALGMALGTLDVSMNARATEVERDWGAPIMSSFHAVWSMGGLAGAALAALFVAAGWSLLQALAASGALAGLLALASLVAARTARPPDPAATAAGPRLALPSRPLAALCAIAAVCFTMEGAVADWLAVYLRSDLAAPPAMASAAYSAFALAMAAGRLGGDYVVRRLGPTTTQRLGGGLAALGLAGGLAVPWPLASAACFALVGLGVSNIVPVMFSAAGGRAGAIGVATAATCGYFGLMAGPPLIGLIAQGAGLRAALLLVLLGAVALVALAPAVRAAAGSRLAPA